MEVIVRNNGYLKLEDVLKLEDFSIYETTKKTHILVEDTHYENIDLYYVDHSRSEWKTVAGKKIRTGQKIFDSKVNPLNAIDVSKWNNGNQIMSYYLYER